MGSVNREDCRAPPPLTDWLRYAPAGRMQYSMLIGTPGRPEQKSIVLDDLQGDPPKKSNTKV